MKGTQTRKAGLQIALTLPRAILHTKQCTLCGVWVKHKNKIHCVLSAVVTGFPSHAHTGQTRIRVRQEQTQSRIFFYTIPDPPPSTMPLMILAFQNLHGWNSQCIKDSLATNIEDNFILLRNSCYESVTVNYTRFQKCMKKTLSDGAELSVLEIWGFF